MSRTLLIVLFVFELAPAQQQPQADMLPLHIGNSWTYDYYADSFINGFGLIVQIDSGTATYKVNTLATFTDFTVWTVSVIRNLTHRTIGPFFPQDTTWAYSDTASLFVVEDLIGRHRMYCANPVPADGVFAFDSECTDTTAIYRFWPDPGSDTLRIRSVPPTVSDSSMYAFVKGIGIVERVRIMNAVDVGAKVHHRLRTATITKVQSDIHSPFPDVVRLHHAFPNPFNPTTTVNLTASRSTHVSLTVIDLLGRAVATLHKGVIDPGPFTAEWNASHQPSGLYFIVLHTDNQIMTERVLLLK